MCDSRTRGKVTHSVIGLSGARALVFEVVCGPSTCFRTVVYLLLYSAVAWELLVAMGL